MRILGNAEIPKAVHLYELRDGVFSYAGKVLDIDGELEIVDDKAGDFFVPTYGELVKLEIDEVFVKARTLKEALLTGAFKIKKFEEEVLMVREIDEQIIAVSEGSYKYYDVATDTFQDYTKLAPEFKNGQLNAYYIMESGPGYIDFMLTKSPSPLQFDNNYSESNITKRVYARAIKVGDSYEWDNEIFQEVHNELGNSWSYQEENGITWFCGILPNIIRYDPGLRTENQLEFKTYISSIQNLETGTSIHNSYNDQSGQTFDIPFANNSIRLEYAGLSFDLPDSIYYRYQLVGFDKEWSRWTHEASKDYTKLGPGTYTFNVQAVHPIYQKSDLTSVSIYIIPPWYATWWAYTAYFFLFTFGIYGLIKFRVRTLEKQKDKLEEIVHERTLQLEQQAEHLKEMDQVKNRFFANISHEFRTPLTLILGPLSKMHSGEFTGDSKSIYGMMIRNAKRLQNLINELLELSRIESGKIELKTTKVEFVSLIKMIFANYTTLAKTKKIDYRFNSSFGQSEVYVDPDKMEKVINNLLSNAFKFTHKGGRIDVILNETMINEKPWLEMKIADTGKGIPVEQQELVFNRFYRVEQNTYDTEGTGIGLALVKELVELHRGKILLDSIEGKGTTLTVMLQLGKDHLLEKEITTHPVKKFTPEIKKKLSEEKIFEERTSQLQEIDEHKNRLLIVEDNKDMRDFIKISLSGVYQIDEAINGLEGLNKAIKTEYDLIISDVMMPEMDGISMCKGLKTNTSTSHIPIILLTAKADHASKLEGLQIGADDYLSKPFNEDELLVIIKNRIEQRKLLREKWTRNIKLEPSEITVTSADEKFLKKIMKLVEEHMHKENFGVNECVQELGLSRSQLHRKIKALTNQSTTEFIRSFRLKRAYAMITNGAGDISEIAYKVGFSSPQYFSRSFKKQFGHAPGETKRV